MTAAIRLARAARIVRAGGVIAYPTEAVYGLGCLPLERDAVLRLLAMKRRSWRKGLIVIGASIGQIEEFAALPADAGRRAEVLDGWPGPITWVLEAHPFVPAWLTGGRPGLAVRVTDHPVARALCERAGSALVSTSANVSSRPPARTALAVRRAFGAALDDLLAAPIGGRGAPTPIRDGLTGRTFRAG